MPGRTSILDAGPCLTFCAAHAEHILVGVLSDIGNLTTPEAVDAEVRRKSKVGTKFEAARGKWMGLKNSHRITILSDAISTPGLLAAAKLADLDLESVRHESKDRGERMVIIHALAMRGQGIEPVVLVDDGYGQQLARRHRLTLLNSEMILIQAVKRQLITNKADMRGLYERMRQLDDGLVHISQTRLLAPPTWS